MGGNLLWGHEKNTQEEALDIARNWVDNEELPPIRKSEYLFVKQDSHPENYFTKATDILRADILAKGGITLPEELLAFYVLLVFVKGIKTTAEDVHYAWSAWKRGASDPELVSPEKLGRNKLNSYAVYVKAIHATDLRIRRKDND